MSRARKLKFLSCLVALLALAGLAGCATRWRLSRTTPLALAQAAHAQWISRPEGKLSSIRTLSANSPALMALAAISPAVPFHTIIGQKNPGAAHSGNDGVVAYSSSHLDGAESELIVRYGHEAFLHPDAIAEIKRILRAHLESM
jgi:hypothetical protein